MKLTVALALSLVTASPALAWGEHWSKILTQGSAHAAQTTQVAQATHRTTIAVVVAGVATALLMRVARR